MSATWALKPWQEHSMTATWALKAWKNNQQAPSTLAAKRAAQPLGSGKTSLIFPSCSGRLLLGLATLEPSLLGLRLGLGHGLLGLALALVGLAIALLLLGLALGSWLLGCSLGLGLLELVLEPVLMEHGPTLAQGIPPWVPTQLASGTVGNLAREHPAPNKSFALVHRLQSVLVHCVSLSARLPKSTCSGGKNMVYCSICNLLPFHD